MCAVAGNIAGRQQRPQRHIDLERQGVVTRAFADVGVRVTIASAEWNDRFLAALATVRPR